MKCSTLSWLEANQPTFKNQQRRLSAAAQLLWHQQGVVAVDLQKVEQEEPVSVRIQAHGPHALLGYGGVGASCHLAQRLENPVVLFQEKPRVDQADKADESVTEICSICSFFPTIHISNCGEITKSAQNGPLWHVTATTRIIKQAHCLFTVLSPQSS